MLTRIEATVAEHTAIIMAQRESILRAFIAEHGCRPSDCEQVIANTDTGMKYFIRRRSEEVDMTAVLRAAMREGRIVYPAGLTTMHDPLGYPRVPEAKPWRGHVEIFRPLISAVMPWLGVAVLVLVLLAWWFT